jgi:glyceraldehyde 3-phosphate dehydrogenase
MALGITHRLKKTREGYPLATIGIHGLGRIGRALLRGSLSLPVEIACINDYYPDDANLLYLVRHDSLYGRLPVEAVSDSRSWRINGKRIARYTQSRLDEVPWAQHGVRVVIDASGAATHEECKAALASGVETILLTRGSSDADITIIPEVNGNLYQPSQHHIISASTCDGVALATVLTALQSYVVVSGSVLTLHPWLSNQNLLDGPSSYGVDYALGRSAPSSVLPRATSVLGALSPVMPALAERMICMSYRVPTNAVSSLHLCLNLESPTKEMDLLCTLKEWSSRHPAGLQCSDEPAVSIDYLGATSNATADLRWTTTDPSGHLARTVVWYDNELGYAHHVLRLVDLVN